MNTTPGNRESGTIEHNEARLAGLYEEYFDKIARYAQAHIGDRTEAQDLASEVFLRALRGLKSYSERGVPMRAWLFRIAHNLVVDHLRRKARQKTVPIDEVEVAADADTVSAVEKSMALQQVAEAMEQLTREQREVLRLRFFGGLSSKEAGDVLKKSDGAVREMQRAAIEKLRLLLGVER